MAGLAECIHELPAGTCVICRAGQARGQAVPARPARGDAPAVEARYHGTCAECREHIRPGDTITPDGDGGWLCEPCGIEDA